MISDPDHALLAGSASQTDQTHSPQTGFNIFIDVSVWFETARISKNFKFPASSSPFLSSGGDSTWHVFKSSFLEEKEKTT